MLCVQMHAYTETQTEYKLPSVCGTQGYISCEELNVKQTKKWSNATCKPASTYTTFEKGSFLTQNTIKRNFSDERCVFFNQTGLEINGMKCKLTKCSSPPLFFPF